MDKGDDFLPGDQHGYIHCRFLESTSRDTGQDIKIKNGANPFPVSRFFNGEKIKTLSETTDDGT
jgi:hypothetical protein